jgi:integrase
MVSGCHLVLVILRSGVSFWITSSSRPRASISAGEDGSTPLRRAKVLKVTATGPHPELGQDAGHANYTVRQAADDWLTNGMDGRSPKTVKKNENVLEPLLKAIGARKLRELTAVDVRHALSRMAADYSGSVVTMGHLALKRTIRHAEANDLVARNVATLVDTPSGQHGRPSKSLTLDQAGALIATAKSLPVMELRSGLKDVRQPAELMYAYIALSLLVGVRTEEARALRWDHVNLPGDPDARPQRRRTSPCGCQSARTRRPRPNARG